MSGSGYVPIPPGRPAPPNPPPGPSPPPGKYVPHPPTIKQAAPTVLLTNGRKLCPICHGHGYIVKGPPLALCPTCKCMGSYHP